ncbi:MAG: hypothetical protein WBD74_03730 [Candidatus Aquilonibacter sp.]
MNKNEGYGFLVAFGAGLEAGLAVGFVDFIEVLAGLAVGLVDFIEVELFAPAFGDADGLAEVAASAGTVIRNAAARNDAMVFFIEWYLLP